jgi:hypothetical protein
MPDLIRHPVLTPIFHYVVMLKTGFAGPWPRPGNKIIVVFASHGHKKIYVFYTWSYRARAGKPGNDERIIMRGHKA